MGGCGEEKNMKQVKIILSVFIVSCAFAMFGVSAEEREEIAARYTEQQNISATIPVYPAMWYSDSHMKMTEGSNILYTDSVGRRVRARVEGRTTGDIWQGKWMDANPKTSIAWSTPPATYINIPNVTIQRHPDASDRYNTTSYKGIWFY